MAKLHFRYSAMNAGKSLDFIATDFNYQELEKRTLKLITGVVGKSEIKSRAGLSIEAKPISRLFDIAHYVLNYYIEFDVDLDCILVDEAQFLTEKQVYELHKIAHLYNIPVICYGLRTDFMGEPFEGAIYLLALADELEEKTTLCHCGKKARMILKVVNGEVVEYGEQIEIDGNREEVKYHSVCSKHFLEKKYKG